MGKQEKGNGIDVEKINSIIKANTSGIPLSCIPFLNSYNYDYIDITKASMKTVEGEQVDYYAAKINCSVLAEHIINGDDLNYDLHFKFVQDSMSDSFMIYIYKDGYYQQTTPSKFKGFLKPYIPIKILKNNDINDLYDLLVMEDCFYCSNNDLNSDVNYINFKNGLLNLRTMKLEPHTPEKIFTVQIPVDYVPLDECTYGKVFEKYLDDLTCSRDKVKKVLLECMGLVLSNIPGYRTKKCLLMIGKKDCGKTQIKTLLSRLIGEKYTSSIELKTMNENRFGTSQLYNKRLVGSNDMQYGTSDDMGKFKQLTGGDVIDVEFKGRGAFPYVFNGFIWFLANDFPMFSGKKGNEIYDRFLIIPCEHVVPLDEQNPFLIDDMLKEKEYIVSLCVNHLRDLINRKFKFDEDECMRQSLKDYEMANNTLLQFVNECCIIPNDDKERILSSDFKKNYKTWCNNNGNKAMKCTKKEIEDYLLPKFGIGYKTSNGRYLTNVKMNEEVKEEYSMFSSG